MPRCEALLVTVGGMVVHVLGEALDVASFDGAGAALRRAEAVVVGAIRLAVSGEDEELVPLRAAGADARVVLPPRPLAQAYRPARAVVDREPALEPVAEADRLEGLPVRELTMADRVTKATMDGRTARLVLRGMLRGSWPEPLPRTNPPLRNR